MGNFASKGWNVAAICLVLFSTAGIQAQVESANTLRISEAGKVATLDAAALKSKTRKTVTVTNGHSNQSEEYSGVLLVDLLPNTPTGKALHGKALASYVVAEGSDHYRAILSLAEIDPTFHPGDVLVADTLNGKPIDAKDGPFKLIVTEDKHPARWVRNLISITVVPLQ